MARYDNCLVAPAPERLKAAALLADAEVETLVAERQAARKRRDFVESDRLRSATRRRVNS